MTAARWSRLFAVIRDLKARGVAILFVSHFLDQVYEISDRITVLRNGRLIGEHLVGDLPREALVTEMIGRALDEALGAVRRRRARDRPHRHARAECVGHRPQGHSRAG
ncbi:hypothetical protein GCM10025876_29760 [Demequina litorisediminis]|uniref:Sugar ABC transporter ATP-binding protein n=1 Tax=Demequina litorisediminis TaxID=1849022 RepID=A0ABQ6IJ60_9MICO|nr:hypothetical protein GCM10025876_29760 [Demequina litorisediminis]